MNKKLPLMIEIEERRGHTCALLVYQVFGVFIMVKNFARNMMSHVSKRRVYVDEKGRTVVR